MARKDPADWWKEGVNPEDLSNFESEVGQPWESPPLVFIRKLVVGHAYTFTNHDSVNAMLVGSIKDGIPHVDESYGLLRKKFIKANYLGTIEQCRWLPEDLLGENVFELNFQKCVFIGNPAGDKELYVFVLLVTQRPPEELGYDNDDLEPV